MNSNITSVDEEEEEEDLDYPDHSSSQSNLSKQTNPVQPFSQLLIG